ncbi:aconitase X catalytic domain-containing protein [Caldivirga sp.]|uniref:aconitase X catalytic domain-containing protein n=1 Tax=Caldivirga sp. TaxID=2080243 RepID=UPI003D0E056A
MYVSSEDERLLREGGYLAKALETVIKVGEAVKADRLLDVDTVHVSGVSYLTIGEAGLEFLRDISSSGARFRVFTTVNPAGVEYGNLNLPVNEDFVKRQMEIVDYLSKMGASLWLTCSPYEFIKPQPGSIHAWGESNAIAYINSVNDAYTEKLPGPFTIMVAIAGKVPRFGLYVEENRVPKVIVKVNAKLTPVKAGLLGRVTAGKLKGEVPFIDYDGWDKQLLKSFLASYATYSPTPLAVIKGVNPNWRRYLGMVDKPDFIIIDEAELRYEQPSDYDALFIGCPHANLEEVMSIVKVLERHGYRKLMKPLIVSTSRFIKSSLSPELINRLREANVYLITDTCPMVSPILQGLGIRRVASSSSKAIFYLPRLVNVNAMPCSIEDCLENELSNY